MKKTLSLIIAVMMVFSLLAGFGNVSLAKADDGPTTQQLVEAVLKAKADHLKEVSKIPDGGKKPAELKDKIPAVEIDGVPILKDVAEAKHIKSGDDFIEIAVDLPDKPLLTYAKEHNLTLKQAANKKLASMKSTHEKLKNKLLSIGVELKDIHDMYVAYNGIAFNTRVKDIKKMYEDFGRDKDIARIYNDGFKKTYIHIEHLYKPVLDNSVPLIGSGSSGVWSDPGVDGTGMYVGVVDTGIDYTHPDFGGHPGISFPTTKVPAGYDFGDNDPDPMDCQGHGTHVSGIIAADGAVKGVAPKAKIVFAKIVPGCTGSASNIVIAEAFDYMADPTNVDGGPEGTHPPVASVNMSFGADYGFVDSTEPDQQAIEACIASGIPVALAAGNAYWSYYDFGYYPFFPDYASIGSPAVTPNCMAVGASWNTSSRYPALTELSSSANYAYTVGAESPDPVTALGNNGGAGYEYVYCGLGGSPSDFPASVAGKIALIQRGSYYFETKINNAAAAGAIGAIIFNSASGGDSFTTMEMGSATLPSVFIGHSAGEALLAKAQAPDGDGTGRVAFNASTYVDVADPVDTMVNFSSWGPPPDLSFKPDITAPGGGIWSTVPVAQGSYANFSGTSMASPHVAACMALVKEAHSTWTPDQIKTALMNTSKIIIDPAYGAPYSPHLIGAGRVDVYNAVHTDATVVNKADGKPYVALGEIPDYRTNPVTFTVTLTNNGSSAVTYNISSTVQTTYFDLGSVYLNWFGAAISSNPSNTVTVPAGSIKYVTVTIDATNVPDWSGWPYLEGFVTFTPQGTTNDPGGVPAGQIHIPYMGFLGKWNDFNENDWQFNPVMDPRADDPMNFMSWLFDEPVTWPWVTDGPYGYNYAGVDFDGNLDENAIAFNPNSAYLEADVGLLRNAQNLTINISQNGANIKTIDSIDELPKNPVDWYGWYWYYSDPVTGAPWWWDGTDGCGTPTEDGKYSLDLLATAPKIFNKTSYDDPQVISFPVSVDRVPPTTAVTAKTNADGSVTLNWTVSDAAPSSGIWGFGLVLGDDLSNVILLPPDTTSYTVSSMPAGPHPFRVMAIDNANNVGVGNPPTVKFSAKVVKGTSGQVISDSFNASDPDGDSLRYSVTVSPVPNGTYFVKNNAVHFKPAPSDVGSEYTFTLVATDPAGYSGSDTFKVVVIKPQDTTPPSVDLPGVDLNNETLTGNSSFGFKVIATDDSGSIARILITDNGTIMKDMYGYTDNFNIPLFEGSNTITVKVFDRAGNIAEKEFTVVSDTRVPIIKLGELPKTVTSAKLNLSGTVFDMTSGVSLLTVNGKQVDLASNGKFSAEITLKAGDNTIEITARDKAGNTRTETYEVKYAPRKATSIMVTLRIDSPYINVNGISKAIDSEGSRPVIKNGRTLLPVRVLIESLGGSVSWNADTRQVGIELNGHSILLTIDSNCALVDGIKTKIDPSNLEVVPVIINGRTYLPVRFIAENLGAMVDWDPATETVTIYYMP
jgi:lactocepin